MSRLYPSLPVVGVGAVILRTHESVPHSPHLEATSHLEGGPHSLQLANVGSTREVLIIRRANPPLQGEWSIPGGALELGEKLRDGVAREVLEETGLHVEAGPVLDVFDSIFPDSAGRTQYHYVLIDYLCNLRSGTPKAASDASELRWARPEELEALGMKQVTIEVIRKAFALESQ